MPNFVATLEEHWVYNWIKRWTGMEPIEDFKLVDNHDDWWVASFSAHKAAVDEGMVIMGHIHQYGEHDFEWTVIPSPHGATIKEGKAVSFKQARFLALQAWQEWLFGPTGGSAPRFTL